MAVGLVADEGSIAAEIEVTEGTYVAESSGASFIEVLSEGLDIVPAREIIERNNRTSTVESVPGRAGTKSVSGTVPVELKAGAAGAAPETDPLWLALLGGKRQLAAAITTGVSHTTTRIFMAAVDAAKLKVGDVIKVKEAGAHHVTPITAVVDSGGGEHIDVLIPFAGGFTDNVEISPFTTYFHQTPGSTVSLTNYLGGQIRQKAIGCRVSSCEISGWETGQIAEAAFAVDGLSFEREVGTPLFTPVFDSEASGVLPPVQLGSKLYLDTTELCANALSLSIANTLGFLTSFKDADGRLKSRITDLAISGECNPYMEDDDVDIWTLFDQDTAFKLFAHAANPDTVAGEVKEVVGLYMPNCRLPELGAGIEDGILTDAMSFTAHRSLGNDSIFVTFSE